jgi:Winged helix-turn-helix DNA-binding
VSRIQQVIEALEAERADAKERLEWLEKQIQEFRDRHGDGAAAPAPARSRRRATARRASTRRATARSRQPEVKEQIIEYLGKHAGSTAGEVAKALNLNRNATATRLTQLARSGEIKKQPRGYAVN